IESDLEQRMHRLWISLLSIVASSSAFRLPASPPPKGSSIDSDWSTKNKKQPGFLRLISAWYAMVCLHFFWHHENYDSHMPEVTGWSPVATIPRMRQRPSRHAHCLIAPTGRTRRDPGHRVTDLRRGVAESPSGFSTPQTLHEFCRPREYALVLTSELHDPAHQSLDTSRTSLLQQAPSRRRRFDQLHTAIAGVTHATHKTSPL